MWQDIVMSIGNWIFAFALFPSVFGIKNKPPKWTSLMTAVVLSIFVWCMITLNLLRTAVAITTTASLWWVLFIQKIKEEKDGV